MDICKAKWTILETEIFNLLCLKTGEKLSQRDIAKYLNVSPTAVGNSMKKLYDEEIINIEKLKNINLISINRENKKVKQLKKVTNLKFIYVSGLLDFLEESLAGSSIILFGSYARGEDIYSSDIDIAVIGRKKKDMKIKEFEKILNKNITLNFYDSWKEINKHLKNNILNGILLSGGVDI